MKTSLSLMRNHTPGVPRVPPYHSLSPLALAVAKSAICHRARIRHNASQQGAALPLMSRQSLLERMQTSYDSYIDAPSLESFFFVIFTSDPRSRSAFMPGDITASGIYVRVAGILNRTRLMPLELTRAEATCVEDTPGIGWLMFQKLFGGHWRSEWPQCSEFPGYSDFLCADITVQPFVPIAAGKPGLVLRLPTVTGIPETENSTIHVLSDTLQGDALYYRGKYTRVPVPQIHFHWSDLPYYVRILKLCRYSSDMGL